MAVWNERIKRKRNEMGITLAQVADKLKVTEATAQRYESGSIKNVPYEHMCTYAKLFHCPPQYLMGWAEDDSESEADYDSDVLKEISAVIEENDCRMLRAQEDDNVIIQNAMGDVLATITKEDLLHQYEMLRTDHIANLADSLLNSGTPCKGFCKASAPPLCKSGCCSFHGPGSGAADIMNAYRQLNEAGKEKAHDYILDLSEQIKYISPIPILKAAHERTGINVTDEQRKHDEDILDLGDIRDQ